MWKKVSNWRGRICSHASRFDMKPRVGPLWRPVMMAHDSENDGITPNKVSCCHRPKVWGRMVKQYETLVLLLKERSSPLYPRRKGCGTPDCPTYVGKRSGTTPPNTLTRLYVECPGVTCKRECMGLIVDFGGVGGQAAPE